MRPEKITIEYEGGSKLVVDYNVRNFLVWLLDMCIPKWTSGNHLTNAFVTCKAKVVLPNGTERPFTTEDSIV